MHQQVWHKQKKVLFHKSTYKKMELIAVVILKVEAIQRFKPD